MRNRVKLLRNAAAVLCAAVCTACAVSCFDLSSSRTGLAAKAAGKNPSEPDLLTLAETKEQEKTEPTIDDPLFENDVIVRFQEDRLPGTSAQPDENREWNEVEEIAAGGGEKISDFFVKDSTESGTDLEYELTQEPSVSFRKNGEPEILIYHTHTSEAYSKSFEGFYYTDAQTRTGNRDMSVVAVGEALKKALEEKGFTVVHDTTVNDELYNGSYSRSMDVIQKNLEKYPTIQVTIDLHRDSMTTDTGKKYKPTAVINGRKAAQVMLIAGCDADGSWGDFPRWEENLRLILRAQQKITEMYPELPRPLNFSNCKYNMNATTGSMLVEVGTEVNTATEAKYSGALLGKALGELFDELTE